MMIARSKPLILSSFLLMVLFAFIETRAPAHNIPRRILQVGVIVGAKQQVGYYASINPDCSSRPLPEVRVLTQPQWGTISVEKGEDFTNYAASGPRGLCNKHKSSMILIFYTPKADYTGGDEFDLAVVYDTGTVYSDRYMVNIFK